MGFADPDLMQRRSARGAAHVTTIEIGHAESKQGITVELVCDSDLEAREVVTRATTYAAGCTGFDRCSPGAWVLAVGLAALLQGFNAAVQRVRDTGGIHFALVVPRCKMLEEHPAWPTLVDCAGNCSDPRSPECRRIQGPTLAELDSFCRERGVSVSTAREMFAKGVLVYDSRNNLTLNAALLQ